MIPLPTQLNNRQYKKYEGKFVIDTTTNKLYKIASLFTTYWNRETSELRYNLVPFNTPLDLNEINNRSPFGGWTVRSKPGCTFLRFFTKNGIVVDIVVDNYVGSAHGNNFLLVDSPNMELLYD